VTERYPCCSCAGGAGAPEPGTPPVPAEPPEFDGHAPAVLDLEEAIRWIWRRRCGLSVTCTEGKPMMTLLIPRGSCTCCAEEATPFKAVVRNMAAAPAALVYLVGEGRAGTGYE